MKKEIALLLIFSALATQTFADERSDQIKAYISGFNGNYSAANIEQIKAAAAEKGVSAAEIDSAMGFQAGTAAQFMPAAVPVVAPVAEPAPVVYAPVVAAEAAPVYSLPADPEQRTDVIKNYLSAFGGNYSPENLVKIKIDAQNYGVSASEIDKVLGFKAGTAEASLKNVVVPPPAVVAVNNYVPYAPNLTTSQAKEIADKYKSEFGYYPSPEALTVLGYQLSGTVPVPLKDLLSTIKKANVDEKFSPNYYNMILAGIDPNIYLTLSSEDLSKLNIAAILNSEEPNTALRMAKRQLLDVKEKAVGTSSINNLSDEIIAQSGYLAVRRYGAHGTLQIFLTDAGGKQMDSAGMSSESILRLAYDWGLTFDSKFSESLTAISKQLSDQNINFMPGTIYPGTGSDAGVNLLDIAKGGTGNPNTLGDMTHAKWQDSMTQYALGVNPTEPAGYSSTVRASGVNYVLDALSVNPQNKSSSVNYVAPQKSLGIEKKYMVVTNPVGTTLNGAWFETAEQAQKYWGQNGGGIYDLKTGLPDYEKEPAKYQAALTEKYPQLMQKVNINPTAKVTTSSFTKFPTSLAGIKSSFLKNEASKNITIASSSTATKAINAVSSASLSKIESSPKDCRFNIANDLQINNSDNKLQARITKTEEKLTKLCSVAKSDASGVESSKFLAAYTNELAGISKEAVLKEFENKTNFRKMVASKDATKMKAFNFRNVSNDIDLNAKTSSAVALVQKAEMYQKSSDRIAKAFVNEVEKKNNFTHSESRPEIVKRSAASIVEVSPAPEAGGQTIADYAELAKTDKSLEPSEDDSIFKQINKAYMRNYKKLK